MIPNMISHLVVKEVRPLKEDICWHFVNYYVNYYGYGGIEDTGSPNDTFTVSIIC